MATTSTAKEINVTFQLLSGSDVFVTLPPNCSNAQASKRISEALSVGDAAGDLVLVDTGSGKRILLSSLVVPYPKAGAEASEKREQPPLPFVDGAVILALPAPKLPPERVRRRRGAEGEARSSDVSNDEGVEIENDSDSDDEDPLRYRPPSNKLARFLAEEIRSSGILPEPLLAVLVRVPRGFWLFLVLWPLGALAASRVDLGPIFILFSIVFVIFTNLGKRKPGEASAYSVFNAGFRSLLGELRADAIDEGLRRGNL